MGYSVAIRVKSPALRRKLAKFMAENYRSWQALNGLGDASRRSGDPTTELQYDDAKSAFGFNYSLLAGWEREYVYAIVRWMAIRVGSRKDRFKKRRLEKRVPYLAYDGHEYWPVIIAKSLDEVSEDLQWCACDRHGLRLERTGYMEVVNLALDNGMDPKMLAELRAALEAIPDDEDLDLKSSTEATIRIAGSYIEKRHGQILDELKRLDAAWEQA